MQQQFAQVVLLLLVIIELQLKLTEAIPSVTTRSYNNARTGVNLNEVSLSPQTVNSTSFGKLYRHTVTGHVYSQVLYMPGVTVQSTNRNIILVCTMANNVYAFDADDSTRAGTPLWQLNLGRSVPVKGNDGSNVVGSACGDYRDIFIEIGILSTPVVDSTTNIMYVVATVYESADPIIRHKLYGINIVTGAIVLGPKVIEGSVPGTGIGSVGGILTFNSNKHSQRAGLLLYNGVVYVTFGSYCTTPPYHGWVFAYEESNLNRRFIWCLSPKQYYGSVWMGGQGISVGEDGMLYMISANGKYDGVTEWGDSFLKLDPNNYDVNGVHRGPSDYFTPMDQQNLDNADLDLGTSGAVQIPGTDYIVGGGKTGYFYLVDRMNMGKHSATQNRCTQYFTPTSGTVTNGGNGIHGSAVVWDSNKKGTMVYVWQNQKALRAMRFVQSGTNTTKGLFDTAGFVSANVAAPYFPGGILSLSANGGDNGILWASLPKGGSAIHDIQEALIRAFDANDVTKEIWSSDMVSSRDSVGSLYSNLQN
jgi:hypothetical protein